MLTIPLKKTCLSIVIEHLSKYQGSFNTKQQWTISNLLQVRSFLNRSSVMCFVNIFSGSHVVEHVDISSWSPHHSELTRNLFQKNTSKREFRISLSRL